MSVISVSLNDEEIGFIITALIEYGRASKEDAEQAKMIGVKLLEASQTTKQKEGA